MIVPNKNLGKSRWFGIRSGSRLKLSQASIFQKNIKQFPDVPFNRSSEFAESPSLLGLVKNSPFFAGEHPPTSLTQRTSPQIRRATEEKADEATHAFLGEGSG